jgi:hypothetical protein
VYSELVAPVDRARFFPDKSFAVAALSPSAMIESTRDNLASSLAKVCLILKYAAKINGAALTAELKSYEEGPKKRESNRMCSFALSAGLASFHPVAAFSSVGRERFDKVGEVDANAAEEGVMGLPRTAY